MELWPVPHMPVVRVCFQIPWLLRQCCTKLMKATKAWSGVQ